MRFCPNCDNILIPKNKKLYCKACEEEFELDQEKEGYKIVKKIKHDEKEIAPVVLRESMKSSRISAQDRKAYEEFFGGSEADSY
ncbi:MAG: hypothetical protein KGD73_01525 [Candidatus Lokiarchaeota archaeon]|nr:hypothetical protein [Candidatus Lokiarchaeota archaeon]